MSSNFYCIHLVRLYNVKSIFINIIIIIEIIIYRICENLQ